MKKIIGLLLIVAILSVGCIVMAEDDVDVYVSAVAETLKVETGDQFLVRIEKSVSDLEFLTFRVKGTFDCEMAEIIAPVYTNEKIAVLTNRFDNNEGTFIFEGYDQTISGIDEDVICAILFKAKKTGEFNVNLDGCMLGKANENGFYNLGDVGTEANGTTVTISEDTDGEIVKIIEDPKPQTPYDEIIMGHWAEKGIVVMYKLGALENIADETIDTERSITRGEFATMLKKVCKMKSSMSVEAFSDVEEDSFMYEHINVLKAKKIAEGDGEGKFMPDAPITRQDAFSLIFRAMINMNKVDKNIDAEEYIGQFDDKNEIAPYAVDAFAGMLRAKLLKDKGPVENVDQTTGEVVTVHKCDPTGDVSLAEACHILNKLAEFNILVSRG